MMSRLIKGLRRLFEGPERPSVTEVDRELVEEALIGKTIKAVVQVPTVTGWRVIYLKMTDGSSIHFGSASPGNYGGCIRVQLDHLDGTKSYLPAIPKGN